MKEREGQGEDGVLGEEEKVQGQSGGVRDREMEGESERERERERGWGRERERR